MKNTNYSRILRTYGQGSTPLRYSTSSKAIAAASINIFYFTLPTSCRAILQSFVIYTRLDSGMEFWTMSVNRSGSSKIDPDRLVPYAFRVLPSKSQWQDFQYPPKRVLDKLVIELLGSVSYVDIWLRRSWGAPGHWRHHGGDVISGKCCIVESDTTPRCYDLTDHPPQSDVFETVESTIGNWASSDITMTSWKPYFQSTAGVASLLLWAIHVCLHSTLARLWGPLPIFVWLKRWWSVFRIVLSACTARRWPMVKVRLEFTAPLVQGEGMPKCLDCCVGCDERQCFARNDANTGDRIPDTDKLYADRSAVCLLVFFTQSQTSGVGSFINSVC